MKARQMLEPGESVVVIYTKGPGLVIKPDHTGSTESWTLDPGHAREAKRVIIYHRGEVADSHSDKAAGSNKLYVASMDDVKQTQGRSDGTYTIFFTHCQFAGTTTEDWLSFVESAKGAQNPIRYLP